MYGGRRHFHIPPCHAEPAAREVLLKSAGWLGGGFPAHEKCPGPCKEGRAFSRAVCQGGINALYTCRPEGGKACARGHPGIPFCGFGLEYSGPWQAPSCSAHCRRFCRRWTGDRVGALPGGKTHLRAGCGGRGAGDGDDTKLPESPPQAVTRVTALRIVRSGAGVKIKNRRRNREHHGGDTARRVCFSSSLIFEVCKPPSWMVWFWITLYLIGSY